MLIALGLVAAAIATNTNACCNAAAGFNLKGMRPVATTFSHEGTAYKVTYAGCEVPPGGCDPDALVCITEMEAPHRSFNAGSRSAAYSWNNFGGSFTVVGPMMATADDAMHVMRGANITIGCSGRDNMVVYTQVGTPERMELILGVSTTAAGVCHFAGCT